MQFDLATTDALLSTTRAVRKRLDLDRPVPRAVILECIALSQQAPTGSNTQGWRWLLVDDPAVKAGLADLYGRAFDPYAAAPKPDYGVGDSRTDRAAAVTDSARYLREHFHEVPVLLVPLIEARPDTSGLTIAQASSWGSILPAVWSFLLAARARGLGSAWTTLHLFFEHEAAELLGVDDTRWMQAGLFPIAFTKGTDFQPAPRVDWHDLVSWNRMD